MTDPVAADQSAAGSGPILADELTDAQRAAIVHGGGPLIIVAGPGAGKTDTLVRRAAYLVAERAVAPERLMLTTFTNKAADELYDRLSRWLGVDSLRVHISTIHAFCQSLLLDYPRSHPLGPGFRVLDDREQFLFVYARLSDLGLSRLPKSRPGEFLASVISFFNLCTEERVDPGQIAERIASDGAAMLGLKKDAPEAIEEYALVADAYPIYLELLRREGLVDFPGLQVTTFEMLSEQPELRDRVADRYQYLLVDEYQDTNRLQVELLKLLAQPRYNLTAVGDDDQSIYRFRGATPSSFVRFQDDFPNACRIDLTVNFRATPALVDATARLISHNAPGRTDKELASGRDAPDAPAPVLLAANTCADEAEEVVQTLAGWRREGRIRTYGDVALLFRSVKYHAGEYLDALDRHGVPYRVVADGGFFDREDIIHLRDLIRFCGSKRRWDPRVLEGKLLELSPDTVDAIVRSQRDPEQWSDERILDGLGIREPRERELLRILAGLRERTLSGDLDNLMSLFYDMLNATGYFARCCAPDDGKAAAHEYDAALLNLAQFSQLVDAFRRHVRTQNTYRFGEYLRSLPSRSIDAVRPEVDAEAVQIMTVHQAKGLEFPVVVIGSATGGRFPGRFRRPAYPVPAELRLSAEDDTAEEHLRDQRRLFYVAMTRARTLLVIGAPEKIKVRGSGQSQFVGEIGSDTLIGPKQVGEPPFAAPLQPSSGQRQRISYSALNSYLLCPLQYKLLHECGFVIPYASYFRFGSVLHRVLERIHRMALDGYRPTPAEAEQLFLDAWHPDQARDAAWQQRQQDLGRSYARRYVERHAERFDRIVWVEEDLELPVGYDQLVQGRLDLACRTEAGIEIIDFKVRSRRGLDDLRPRYQLDTYALAAEHTFGATVERLGIHLLAEEPGSELVGWPWDGDAKAAARGRVERAAAGIRARDFEPTPGQHCRYCDFQRICPAAAVRDERVRETVGTDP